RGGRRGASRPVSPPAHWRRRGCRGRRRRVAAPRRGREAAAAPPPPRPLPPPPPPPRARPSPPARRLPAPPATVRSLFALQRLVPQVLMVKLVAELVTFGCQIASVLRRRLGLDRDLLDHLEAVPLDPRDLLRIVRQDPDRREAEVGQDLVADAVVAHVRLEPELEVRLHGVEPVLLQLVRAQLVQ